MGSMSSNTGRPTYLNIGGSYPRFGSEADANALQMDKQLFIKNERDRQSRWQARKKFKYQSLVFSLAMARFFLIGMLELSTEINGISNNTLDSSTIVWISCFAFLLFG